MKLLIKIREWSFSFVNLTLPPFLHHAFFSLPVQMQENNISLFGKKEKKKVMTIYTHCVIFIYRTVTSSFTSYPIPRFSHNIKSDFYEWFLFPGICLTSHFAIPVCYWSQFQELKMKTEKKNSQINWLWYYFRLPNIFSLHTKECDMQLKAG